MEFKKLAVFCKLVELKSFTKTAEAVYLTQPTVSEHIRNLEETLGQKLVDRLGREVLPTPAGELLYGYAQKILRLQQETQQAMDHYGGKMTGRLLIGAGTIPGTYLLPELIGQFRRHYPHITTTLRITGSRQIAAQVIDNSLELGIIGAKWHDQGLAWQKIFADEIALFVAPNHPWAQQPSISIETLQAEPLIQRESGSGTRRVIETILAEHKTNPAPLPVIAEIGSSVAVKEAIRAGIGAGFLSTRAVHNRDRQALHQVNIEGIELTRPFYLIQRKKRALSPPAATFLQYLLQAAGQVEVK